MKNLTKLFLGLLLAGIIFTGCKEATELADVKFTANFEDTLSVVVTPATGLKAGNGVFSETITIDPTSDSDFDKYLNNIKGIDINEVSGLVLIVNPNVTLSSTVLTVSNDTRNATWEFDVLPIEAGTVLILDNADGQWDTIEEILMDKKVFTVSINGQASEESADFLVLVKINSEVLANPISS